MSEMKEKAAGVRFHDNGGARQNRPVNLSR